MGNILKENSEPREWTKIDMIELVNEKTDLILSENFEIITDKVKHTEGALFRITFSFIVKEDEFKRIVSFF